MRKTVTHVLCLCPTLSSSCPAPVRPADVPVGSRQREPQLHRPGPEEIHLRVAGQTAGQGASW